MIEKFSSEESLEEGYKSLEKEFTKKCQELAEAKRTIEALKEEGQKEIESKNVGGYEVEDASIQNEAIPNEETVLEESAQSEGAEVGENSNQDSSAEFFFTLRKKAQEFLMKTPEAKEFSGKIAKEILKDSSILKTADPFTLAFKLVKSEEAEENKVSAVDGLIKPIEEGVKNSFPKVLSGGSNSFSVRQDKKYSSFEDARRDLITKYFS